MAAAWSSGKWGDLAVRTASAVVLVPIVLALAWLGGAWFALLLSVIGVLMGVEWVRLAYRAPSPLPYALHCLAAAAAPWLALAGRPLIGLAAILALWAVSLAHLFWQKPDHDRAATIGVIYVAVPVLSLALLRADAELGLRALLWLMVVVWSADTVAYGVGRLLGGPKLAPRISPGKTWSGFFGAVAGGGAAGAIAGMLMDLPAAISLTILGGSLAVVAQLGDLFESQLKRHAGVKDSGQVIPGHGGILDRVDGLMAVATAALAIGFLREGPNNIAKALLLW
ncbi:phosphatidate cytidylyltransferase [Rhodoligotrophos defluvii]|uniref:phosphatidate cytidylyltransferase n=1 Tax=Rhodoligotrophos defluvii TaxID=2561934 RepID=UPI0010C9F663|nr:phosphatidate cytidylyltransferase [Rhodoligotrophos defluvii]